MNKNVKLSLATRNVESLITLGNSVCTSMAANPKFPSPPVVIADLKTAIENLEKVHEICALTRSLPAYAEERSIVTDVSNMLSKLGRYVDNVASGDEQVIFSAGMPSSKNRAKNPVPNQITEIKANFTGISGTLELVWKRPEFSKMFKVYMTTNPDNPTSWQLVDTVSSRKLLVQNLATGTRFYFRVIPVGTAGAGVPSVIADNLAA